MQQMPYQIEIKRQAKQKIKSLSRPDRLRITDAIDELALDPDSPTLDTKRLQGMNLYRLRVGDWRVIYARLDTVRIITVEKIGARGDVYK